MYTRERRQLRLFVRRDIYGRYLSCLVYLPRDRYNTTVRERIAQILKDRLGGDSIEYTARVSESSSARLHFVVHPPQGETVGDVDVADLERRLAEAARSWRDDFTAAVITKYGEEHGSRLARRYVDAFPEAYKEDLPPPAGAVDLGRIEDIEGDEGLALSLYEQVDAAAARPGSRSSASGRRCRCPRCCRSCPRWASRSSTSGPTARGPGPGVLHLRLRAALRPPAARPARASCSRTRCARSGTGTTRATASTRSCSAPG